MLNLNPDYIVHLLCWSHTRAKFLFSSIIAKDAEAFWFVNGKFAAKGYKIKKAPHR